MQGRVVVSVDKKTLPVDAWQRVVRGLPMPGVVILRTLLTIGQAINELELVAVAGNPDDLRNQVMVRRRGSEVAPIPYPEGVKYHSPGQAQRRPG